VPAKVKATTANVDAELATQAGPQLVVPILNARYALNAANARWGSLYDALYGTDAISEADGCEKGPGYNPKRGAKVIEYARHVLDRTAPLKGGSHKDSTGYAVEGGKLVVRCQRQDHRAEERLAVQGLPGRRGQAPVRVLLQHNGLHLDIRINRSTPIGASDAGRRERPGAGSRAVHHPGPGRLGGRGGREDKVLGYSNWLGILKGTLTET
jgi:malate synthase